MATPNIVLERGAERPAGSSRHSDRDTYALLGLLIAAAALFAVLAAKAISSGPFVWDRSLFARLYTGESTWSQPTPGQTDARLNALLPVLRPFADDRAMLLMMGFVLALLVVLRLKKGAAFFFVAVSVTALAPLLKQVFDRPSPFPLPNDPSFPSGHAIASMALVAGIVAVVEPGRWRLLVTLLGGLFLVAVGLAVITDGGHWPSDVIAGWCVAILWIIGLRLITGSPLAGSDRARRLPSGGEADAPPASAPSIKGV